MFIAIDTLGKEEILVALAEHFKTLIVVDEMRYSSLCSMNLRTELFTTNPQ